MNKNPSPKRAPYLLLRFFLLAMSTILVPKKGNKKEATNPSKNEQHLPTSADTTFTISDSVLFSLVL